MLCPMGILALFALLIGLLPNLIFKILIAPVFSLIHNSPDAGFQGIPYAKTLAASLSQLTPILLTLSFVSFGLIVVTGILMLLKKMYNKKSETSSTWGCGYNKPIFNAQYTGSSYVSPFLSMLKPLFKKVFDVKKPKKLFPSDAHFSLQIEDIEEAYVLSPMVKFDEWFLSKFEKMQSGNLQAYIKYGLIFLILAILGSFLIG